MADYEFKHAFVLHQRAYRETSSIVEFFTQQHGRVSAVCRGIKGHGKAASRLRGIVQPFSEIAVSWTGKTDLKTIRQLETLSCQKPMFQKQLYAGLYLNELMLRLSPHDIDARNLYHAYHNAINALAESGEAKEDEGSTHRIEAVLRQFELQLLKSIGFEIDLFSDASDHHERITALQNYEYIPDRGFLPLMHTIKSPTKIECIPGEVLLSLRDSVFDDLGVLRYAKQIMRKALAPHLGNKPLKSRELYR